LSAWIKDIKGWQKLLQKKKKKELKQDQRRQIEENIDKRCEIIKTDQGKMIASLLNKLYKKITLDRFIEQEEKLTNLTVEPELVKIGVAKHYKKQFRMRDTKLEEMSERWKEVYKPQECIKEELYIELEDNIKEKE